MQLTGEYPPYFDVGELIGQMKRRLPFVADEFWQEIEKSIRIPAAEEISGDSEPSTNAYPEFWQDMLDKKQLESFLSHVMGNFFR